MAPMAEFKLPHDIVNVQRRRLRAGPPDRRLAARASSSRCSARCKARGGKRGVATLCIGGGEAHGDGDRDCSDGVVTAVLARKGGGTDARTAWPRVVRRHPPDHGRVTPQLCRLNHGVLGAARPRTSVSQYRAVRPAWRRLDVEQLERSMASTGDALWLVLGIAGNTSFDAADSTAAMPRSRPRLFVANTAATASGRRRLAARREDRPASCARRMGSAPSSRETTEIGHDCYVLAAAPLGACWNRRQSPTAGGIR